MSNGSDAYICHGEWMWHFLILAPQGLRVVEKAWLPSLPRRGFKGRFWVRFPKPLLLPTLAKDRPGGLKKQNIIKHKLNQKWKQPKKNFINKF
jgi:hypothetical protein